MHNLNCTVWTIAYIACVEDYDPEADAVPDESDRSSDDNSDNEAAGTEHYEAVEYAIYLAIDRANLPRPLTNYLPC
jgi:hypothetical protein